MKNKRRYITFIVGLGLFLLSFLWFATNQAMYFIWIMGGLILSGIAYLFIISKKDSLKNKLILTTVLISAIFINKISESQLIDFSFWTFITFNEAHLDRANQILRGTTMEIIISKTRIYDKNGELKESDVSELKNLQGLLGVNIIAKTESYIYYELYGFLDNRVGIKYIFDEAKKDNNGPLRKVKGSWYR